MEAEKRDALTREIF